MADFITYIQDVANRSDELRKTLVDPFRMGQYRRRCLFCGDLRLRDLERGAFVVAAERCGALAKDSEMA